MNVPRSARPALLVLLVLGPALLASAPGGAHYVGPHTEYGAYVAIISQDEVHKHPYRDPAQAFLCGGASASMSLPGPQAELSGTRHTAVLTFTPRTAVLTITVSGSSTTATNGIAVVPFNLTPCAKANIYVEGTSAPAEATYFLSVHGSGL